MEGTYKRPVAASEIILPVEMPSAWEAPVTPEVAPEVVPEAAPEVAPAEAPAEVPTATEKLAEFFSNLITPTA